MKVELTESRATEVDGEVVAHHAGDKIDLPNDEAKVLLERGSAIPVARTKAQKAEKR